MTEDANQTPPGRQAVSDKQASLPTDLRDTHLLEGALDEVAVVLPGEETRVRFGSTVVMDRYQIEDAIGEGGMGKVFRVRCLRLGKNFALKRMHSSLAETPRLRDTFYREARLASSLSHPNIVSVVDFGEDPDFGLFMVMELLDGEPLIRRVAGGTGLALRTVCEIVLQIADALHYIHGKGIVHGDIKPDNILLKRVRSADRRRWEVNLLDFGLARFGSADVASGDAAAGTPPYMAPERIKGAPPHPSQDLYSLGILAYQLITGTLPFDGPLEQVFLAHVETPPPLLADRLAEAPDERLEALIQKTLAKLPEDRHRDVAAFIYELRTVADMLGYGPPRRGKKRRLKTSGAAEHGGAAAPWAAMGFDLAPLPLALMSSDGTVLAANRAMGRFLSSDYDELEGKSIFVESLVRIHPRLREDLNRLLDSGGPVSRTVTLQRQGNPVLLTFVLIAGRGDQILLAIERPR